MIASRTIQWTTALLFVATSSLVVRGAGSGIARESLASGAALQVTSPAFTADGAIPFPYSGYGDEFSPALSWQGAPASTQSFVLLIEDPDAKAPAPTPFLHWSLFNLPAERTVLNESIPALPRLPQMGNAQQGRNSRGTLGYVGPKPPPGDPPHHYHFEVFALDKMLDLPPGASVSDLTTAMKGHVVGSGEIVGTFSRSPSQS